MARASHRLRLFIGYLVATVFMIAAACLAINCLVDPLWYLQGNRIGKINYPFNERLSKIIRFLPGIHDYDCIIFGTSRASLLPEEKIKNYRCFNLAFSDGQAREYLFYAQYLRDRGFAPKLLIVDIKRSELVGPELPLEVPDFVRSGDNPPSLLANYLSLDALDFSIRSLQGDAPHHRYYDTDFRAYLEVRSKRHYYDPASPIKPEPPPFDVHPERADGYIQLRQKFPMARAIGYLPPESAWRIAAFSLTGGLDTYLAAVGRIAAAYDEFLDFSVPSPMTKSKDPKDTYDGSHYSRSVNERVLDALLADQTDPAVDWRHDSVTAITALYHDRLAQFIAATAQDAPRSQPTGADVSPMEMRE